MVTQRPTDQDGQRLDQACLILQESKQKNYFLLGNPAFISK